MPDINLGESIDISRVGIVYEEFSSALQAEDSVNLIVSDISHIDGAGLQLLYAFIHAAKEQGVSLSVSEPSAKLKSAAELLGLDGLLGFSS